MKKNYILNLLVLILLVSSKQYFSQSVVVLRAGGTITNPAHWGAAPGGTTGTLSDFTADRTYSFTSNNSALTLSSNWGISASSTVALGNNSTGFTLTLASGGVIGSTVSANQPRINVRNNAVFIIQDADFPQNLTKTFPQTGSTFVYSSNAPDVVAFTSAYSNLIIDDLVSLNALTVTVSRLLTINSGAELTIGGLAISTGSIAGSGEIVGNNSSKLIFTSSGNLGTLNMKSGSEELGVLTLPNSTSTLTLGSNLTISDGNSTGFGLTLNSSNIDLNGKTLTVADPAPIDFGSGTFIGSSSSAININTTGSITNDLLMDATANELGGLTLNSTGNALSLGSALNIIDSVSVVDGTLTTNDFLTIKASSSKVGRISEMGAGGAISGNATVESYFAGSQPGWAMIGANGISGQTVANLDTHIDMTCQGCTYGVTGLGSYFESIQGWEEPSCEYDTTITSSSPLTPGKGFWVYLSTGLSTTSDMTWSFTGPVVQGPVSIACSAVSSGSACSVATSSYNLVANPYACPISWTETYNNSPDIGPTAYFYERNTANTPEWNGFSGTGNNGGTDIIAAGQGFGVINMDIFNSTINLNFVESAKTHLNGNPNQLMRSASKSGSNKKPDYIHLRVTGLYDTDQASVVLHNSASAGLDKYDSRKQFRTPGYGGGAAYYSQYTSISTLEKGSNVYLSTNILPQSNTSYTLPLLVRVSTTGSYTITAEDFENYSSCAVLRDKLTNVYTDLKLKPYVFNIKDTTSAPRFELIICESGGGTTPTSINDIYASQNISIGQLDGTPVVKTFFNQPTDAVISVYNLLGQQLVSDIKVYGTETSTQLDHLNLHNQVLIIKVTTANQSVSKRLIIE